MDGTVLVILTLAVLGSIPATLVVAVIVGVRRWRHPAPARRGGVASSYGCSDSSSDGGDGGGDGGDSSDGGWSFWGGDGGGSSGGDSGGGDSGGGGG